jgi:hypothetical protein
MSLHEHSLRPPTPREEQQCADMWDGDEPPPWREGKGVLMIEDCADDPSHPDFWYIENENA